MLGGMSTVRVNLRAPSAEIFAARMQGLSRRGVDRALRSAVTFVAKDYSAHKTGRIADDIDRPRSFSKRAYNWDGASRSSREIEARTYVRPKQEAYFKYLEDGGEKTRSRGRKGGPISIKPEFQDRFGGGWGKGGLQRKFLARSEAKMRSGAGKDARGAWRPGTKLYDVFTLRTRDGETLTGIWQKTKQGRKAKGIRGGEGRGNPRWKTRLIVGFIDRGDYDQPRLNFKKDAQTFGNQKLPRTAKRLLDREIQKATRGR